MIPKRDSYGCPIHKCSSRRRPIREPTGHGAGGVCTVYTRSSQDAEASGGEGKRVKGGECEYRRGGVSKNPQ
jgi:hypothetical protein